MRNRPAYSFRQDNAVPAFDAGPRFTVMDANCSLCAKGAKWIARNDRLGVFKIVPLQSELGTALVRHYGLDPADPVSWLFVENGKAYSSLEALIRVGNALGGRWKILNLLWVIPEPLRDVLYRLVARNRYRWFGRADLCSLPDPDVRERLYP